MKKSTKNQVPVWDLTEIYQGPDDPKINRDLAVLSAQAAEFEKLHQGRIKSYPLSKILDLLVSSDKIFSKLYLLSSFAEFCFSVDTKSAVLVALLQRIERAAIPIQNHLVFFALELAAHPRLPRFINERKASQFKFMFQNLLANKKHLLRAGQEKLLNLKSLTARGGWQKLFTQTDAQIKIKYHGRTINQEQALKMLYQPGKKTRREIARLYSAELKKHSDLFTYIYNMLLIDKMQDDALRGFERPETARHISNGLTQKAVDALIQSAKNNFKLVPRFYNLKRRALGVKKLNYYDRYAPLAAKRAASIPFGQGAAIVARAFSGFDRDFFEIFNKLLQARHIHARTVLNKRGGAYCAAMPKGHLPYILTNYLGELRDIQTLAHESGHAVHDVLASKNYFSTAHPPLTLAETASVFGEMIVFEDLLAKCRTKKERQQLYEQKISDIFATIFRQISFMIFEREAHAAIKKTGQLSASELGALWLKTQKQMYGKSIAFDDYYQYWWSYISHFYQYPFYVYAYAFGNLLVFALWNEYKKQGSQFIGRYKQFLALGGTRSTIEALRQFGFDPEDPGFWEQGFKELGHLIEKFAELC